MIYLYPHNCKSSGLGEDTFWTWMKRELKNTVKIANPKDIQSKDIILNYSINGKPKYPRQTITLLWELYPEMVFQLQQSFTREMILIKNSTSARWLTVTSELMLLYYKDYGYIDILPIGIDTELFKPADKKELRNKYNLPQDKKIIFWFGTKHKMKGYDLLKQYMIQNPSYYYIVRLKRNIIPQKQLSELMAASDYFLRTSRLRPFYVIEWEAMACNLPFINIGIEPEFVLNGDTRTNLLKRKWDRKTALNIWKEYIDDCVSNL